MSDLLYKDAQDAQRKFFYSVTSAGLGALALSIQFSPKMGKEIAWLLLLAWALLFISSVAGGWRLSIETVVLRHQYTKSTTTSVDHNKIDALNEKNQKKISCLTKIQTWTLLGGLLSNLIFAAVNYWCSKS